jgi:hypothetical protein
MAHLPSDVRLYHENRGSPVTLPGRMAQRIRLRLKTGDREIIYLPQSRVFENEVGRYTLSTKNKDGWVTIDREITVGVAAIPAEAWPGLRELLLEETDAAGGTLLMEKSRGEKESVSSSSGVSK